MIDLTFIMMKSLWQVGAGISPSPGERATAQGHNTRKGNPSKRPRMSIHRYQQSANGNGEATRWVMGRHTSLPSSQTDWTGLDHTYLKKKWKQVVYHSSLNVNFHSNFHYKRSGYRNNYQNTCRSQLWKQKSCSITTN